MRALVLSLLLAPAAVYAQTPAAPALDSALDAIAACSETAPEAIDNVLEESRCPGLHEALEDAGYAPFIPSAQRDSFTADSLSDLHALISRYQRAPDEAAPEPDPEALRGILAALEQPPQIEQRLSLWEKLKRWLRERLADARASDAWFNRWLEQFELSQSLTQIMIVTAVVLVLLLALLVLINELRVAGVFRRSSARSQQISTDGAVMRERAPAWSDFERIAPADRPSFVLRMLVAALVRSGRLATERSLTHREISARARLDDEVQRACLARVSTLAEKVVYGGAALDADADAVIAQGRELYARLSVGTS
jgi:hypothetical protein